MLYSPKTRSRRFALAGLAALLATATACRETTHDDDEEPQIASIVITHGTSSVTVTHPGGTASGSLALVADQTNEISVRFLNAAGVDEPVIVEHRSDYEVRITAGTLTTTISGGTGATFTGAITPPVGLTAISIQLFNKDHNHEELTRSVPVTM